MKSILLMAMVTLFGGCKCAGDAAGTAPAEPLEVRPPAPIVEAESHMKNYMTQYASTARSSRVETLPHRLSALSRLARLDAFPVIVRVDSAGRYAVDSIEVREVGFLPGTMGYDQSRRETARSINSGDVEWATLVGPAGSASVATSAATKDRSPHENRVIPAFVTAESVRFPPEGPRMRWPLWSQTFPGLGCGAIAPDGRVAIGLRAGRFLVLDANQNIPEAYAKPVVLVDVKLDFPVYDMSITESGYALLADAGATDTVAPRTKLESAWAFQARRIDMGELVVDLPPRWRSALHHLDSAGKETWQADIPFEVFMPPVDAGRGRIYVFGMGFAGIQDGKVMFVTPSPVPMFGTSFGDGTMAIAAGPELRLVDRDGKILQKLATPEGDNITTPPAIAADGSIWVGTATAVYVARAEADPSH